MAGLSGLKQIGAYIGVNPKSISDWRRSRGFPVVLIGGGKYRRLVTTTDAVTAWLNAHGQAQLQTKAAKDGGSDG